MASVCLAAGNTLAQSNAGVVFWKKAVADKSIIDLAAALHDKDSPSWPRIDSTTRDEAGGTALWAKGGLALIEALHAKLGLDFKSDAKLSLNNVRAYRDIATALQDADGYSNLLLADTLNRLAIYELSGCLIKNIASHGKVKALAAALHVPDIETTTFLQRLTPDDAFLTAHREALANINTSGDVFGAIQSLGIPPNKISYDLMLPANQSVARLLREPSAVELLLRRTTTHLLANVSLAGLLSFIERGGKYEELNPVDITPFLQRMAGAERSFQDKLSGVKSLGVGQLLSLYNLHNDPEKREVFLKIALD